MADNPYEFDNDSYQNARDGLNYYIDLLWLAGADRGRIIDTVKERVSDITTGAVDASLTAPEPDAQDTEPQDVNEDETPEDADPTEEVEESEPQSNEDTETVQTDEEVAGSPEAETGLPAEPTDEDAGRPIPSSEIP